MLEEAGDDSDDDDTSFLTDDSMRSGADPSKKKKDSANQPEPQREPVQPPPTQASAPKAPALHATQSTESATKEVAKDSFSLSGPSEAERE